MQSDLQKRPKLLIVSDTAVSYDNGVLVGFEPVVREIEHFYHLFESITWIASLHSEEAKNRRALNGIEITVIPCKQVGGKGLKNRLNIIREYFHLFFLTIKEIKKADVIHSRGPSHAAIVCVFLSFFIRKDKVYWHKYAGNWVQLQPPISYGVLRFLLNKATHTNVTINGHWPHQLKHLLTFENPCLTEEDRMEGQQSVAHKDFSGKLDFVFIGRLEDAKGVHRILEVLSKVDNPRIGKVHLIGDGSKREEYEEYAKNHCKQEIIFHGFLKKDEINKVLSPSHVFLLPSDSEGFPKVVAEAANYGLIPIVSDVSCIGQYVIDSETGYLIPPKDTDALEKAVCIILDLSEEKLSYISRNCFDMASSFTFGHYNDRIKSLFIDK